MVASRSSSRRKSGASHPPPLKSSQLTTIAAASSTQLDAIQLRDEVLHLRKEMNALKKEKDIAKAQQVFHKFGVFGYVHTSLPACVKQNALFVRNNHQPLLKILLHTSIDRQMAWVCHVRNVQVRIHRLHHCEMWYCVKSSPSDITLYLHEAHIVRHCTSSIQKYIVLANTFSFAFLGIITVTLVSSLYFILCAAAFPPYFTV